MYLSRDGEAATSAADDLLLAPGERDPPLVLENCREVGVDGGARSRWVHPELLADLIQAGAGDHPRPLKTDLLDAGRVLLRVTDHTSGT